MTGAGRGEPGARGYPEGGVVRSAGGAIMDTGTRAGRRLHGAPLAGLLLAAGLAACGGDPPPPPPDDGPPQQLILLYDRSSSIQDHELQHYRELTDEVAGELGHGDRLVAMELLQLSLTEAPRRWAQEVPEREFQDRAISRDSVALARFVTDVRDYLTTFTDVADREELLGTDILSTLQNVGDEVRSYPGYRTILVIFSDMLHATRDLNMEGLQRMPGPEWAERTAAEGRLPDLSGVCVLVAGARVDTPEAQRVKSFWTDYFQATGATLLDRNYGYRPPRLVPESCP